MSVPGAVPFATISDSLATAAVDAGPGAALALILAAEIARRDAAADVAAAQARAAVAAEWAERLETLAAGCEAGRLPERVGLALAEEFLARRGVRRKRSALAALCREGKAFGGEADPDGPVRDASGWTVARSRLVSFAERGGRFSEPRERETAPDTPARSLPCFTGASEPAHAESVMPAAPVRLAVVNGAVARTHPVRRGTGNLAALAAAAADSAARERNA